MRPLIALTGIALLAAPAMAQPVNDDCQNALPIAPGDTFSVSHTTATVQSLGLPCSINFDLWYRLDAADDMTLLFEMDGGTINRFAVYHTEAPCPLPADEVLCAIGMSIFNVEAGESYLIRTGRGSSSPPSTNANIALSELPYDPTPEDDERYRFLLPEVYAAPGQVITAPLIYDPAPGPAGDPYPLAGWSFGFCYDPTRLALIDVDLGEALLTINNGGPVARFNTGFYPDGVTIVTIVDLFGNSFLPPLPAQEVYEATFEVISTLEGPTDLVWCTLGNPPVAAAVVSTEYDYSRAPQLFDGSITITPSPGFFRRGDVNGDGALDIADAIALSDYLFVGGAVPPCIDAVDGNDDGLADVADIVTVLGHLFSGTGALPAPFSGCGMDPTADSLVCLGSTGGCGP